jgi:hypothetical protein
MDRKEWAYLVCAPGQRMDSISFIINLTAFQALCWHLGTLVEYHTVFLLQELILVGVRQDTFRYLT